MPVLSGDIKFYHSGGAGNSDPNASLGGAKSTTEITDAQLENLFDDVASAEAAAGDTNYRCFYVENTNGTGDTLAAARTFFQQLPVVTGMALGLDANGKNGTAVVIGDETIAPAGVTFSAPTDYAGGEDLTDLAPAEFYAIWLRRVVAPGAVSNANDLTIVRVQGDTA